jgi:hypothetical protein
MKKNFLLITCCALVIYSKLEAQSNAQTHFESILDQRIKRLNGESGKKARFLSQNAYDKVAQQHFSRISSNPTLLNQPGSFASLKLSEENTIADLQATLPIRKFQTVTLGFNAVVDKNVADLYTGSDGINPDWGVRAGYSKQIKSKIYYFDKNLEELKDLRKDLQTELLFKYWNQLAKDYNTLKNQKNLFKNKKPDHTKDRKYHDLQIEEFREITTDIAFLDSLSEKGVVNDKKIKDFIDEKIAALEVEKAKINGYASYLFVANTFYNRKGFTQFFPSALPISSRFVDTAYNNWGVNFGVSYFRFTSFYLNASISLGYSNKSNLELEENQKYNRSYTTQVGINGTPSGTNQYYETTKKAFDSTVIGFDTFGSVDGNAQATMLFGKTKSYGFNVFLNYSNASIYTIPNKLNIGIGPVVSIANSENSASKLNLSLFGSLRNVFDKSTNTMQKFVVSFNVQVPFTFMK